MDDLVGMTVFGSHHSKIGGLRNQNPPQRKECLMTEVEAQGWEGSPGEMAGLTQLARIAWEEWEEYAPTAFGMIKDPRTFFSSLGERAQEEETRLAAAMQGPDKLGESTIAKAGRIQQAMNAAREQVIVGMCRPPADLMEEDSDDLMDDREAAESWSTGVNYYLLPWIEEEPDPEEDEDMYDLYWSLIGRSTTHRRKWPTRRRSTRSSWLGAGSSWATTRFRLVSSERTTCHSGGSGSHSRTTRRTVRRWAGGRSPAHRRHVSLTRFFVRVCRSEHRDVRHRSAQGHEGEDRGGDDRSEPHPTRGVVEGPIEQRQHHHHGEQGLQHIDVEPVRRPEHRPGREEGDVLDDEDGRQADGIGQRNDEPVDPAALVVESH